MDELGEDYTLEQLIDEAYEDIQEMKGGPYTMGEIYSPPKIVAETIRRGIKGLWSLDLMVMDPLDGQPWDFNNRSKRTRAMQIIQRDRPSLVIGSPMCTAFSLLQNLGKESNKEKKEKLLKNAVMHVRFCCEIYKLQVAEGRYFLHEHPQTASSWKLKCVQEVEKLEGVMTMVAHMCQYGMTSKDDQGFGPVLKPTKFMGNSECIMKRLQKRCDRKHRHVQLVNGRAKKAQEYPKDLCIQVCKGLKEQDVCNDMPHDR